jgi:hypothetical protein
VARRVTPSLLSPTAYLRRNAFHQGLLGGRRGWMVVGALLWAPRVAKRLLGRNEQVVAVEKLKPGQFVRIEALVTPSRADKKAAKRAARLATSQAQRSGLGE